VATGVPFIPPDYEEFKKIAFEYKGNVTAISKRLNIIPHTLYKYFKRDPKGKEIIDEIRGYNTFTDLDLAENVVRYNMANHREEPSIAQRAAEFTLGYKGKERGWIKDEINSNVDSSAVDKTMELINLLQNQSSDFKIADSNINNADKSILETGEDIA